MSNPKPFNLGEVYRIHPVGSKQPHDYVVLTEPSLIDQKSILVNFTCASHPQPKGSKLTTWDQNDQITVNGDFKLVKPSVLRVDQIKYECHNWMFRNKGVGPRGVVLPAVLESIRAECYRHHKFIVGVAGKHVKNNCSDWERK